MKTILAFLISLSIMVSCKREVAPPKYYGQTFDTVQIISVAELMKRMEGQQKVEAVVKGEITESCQAEGCWLNLKNDNGAAVFVDWDRQFNIPKEVEGRQAIAKGFAYIDSTQSPKVIAFKASGVFL
ncbi:MAG: DUF4920 domain-containing protein [Chitinophagales bacterium]|nr:DUF4920 domain-containing protein [Chitinophagales bacterium]